jgi:hypothetical protein
MNSNYKGFIVVKENISLVGTGFFLDKVDFTVMRGIPYFEQLFDKAGLEVVVKERFVEFPADCLPVMKFALRPK